MANAIGRQGPSLRSGGAHQVECKLIVTSTDNPRTISHLAIGTRGSVLALWQANAVRTLLDRRFPGLTIGLDIIRPEGDLDKRSSLLRIGGRGVFASALQSALLAGAIDLAVHSSKDVPTIEPKGLVLAAFPEREDARDAVVSRHGVGLAELPGSPVIGTSSRRRAVQVRALRPDATIVDLRGNIDTRLRRAESSAYDAVILAAAGLTRMGWQDRITEYLPFETFVPSPGQGALAIETRADPDPAHALAAALDMEDVALAVRLERAFLGALGGGCTMPIGAHAEVAGDEVRFWAMMAADDGTRISRVHDVFPAEHALDDVRDLAARMTLDVAPGRSGAALNGGALPQEPLAGRQALITGTPDLVDRLGAAFAAERANVMDVPTLEILPGSEPETLAAALEAAADGAFDWLVITSRQTLPALGAFGVHRLAGKVKVAAVGAATAAALRDAGLPVDLTPQRQTGEGLVAAFDGIDVQGANVLCLLGNLAGDTVTAGLTRRGAIVTRVESYRTRDIDHLPARVHRVVRAGRIDLAVFSSPSSVRTLVAHLGVDLGALSGACLVAIGPTTRGAMIEAGLPVHVVADLPAPEAIVAACRAWFAERSGYEAQR